MHVTDGAEFLSVREVARRLRLSDLTVYRRVWDGTLPAVRLSERGALRIPAAELERLLETRDMEGA